MVIAAVRKVLAFEMTIAEWIGTAILLAVPYLVVGVGWTVLRIDHIPAPGSSRIVSIVVSIVSWPALLVSTVCMA